MVSEFRRSAWRRADEHADFPRGAFANLLTFPGSLTAELTRLGEGEFALELIAQQTLAAQARASLLAHEDGAHWLPGLCREVMMYAGGRPVVAARTLVPEETARAQGWLGELGGRSLGHALFEREDVTRSPFEFAPCHARGDLVQRVRSLQPAVFEDGIGATVLWARRSHFRVGGLPLMVMELFLPQAAALVSPVASVGIAP